MANQAATETWPELAIGLYDKLTGRNAEIKYSFDDLQVEIPSSTQADGPGAKWKLSGDLRISTRNLNGNQ